MLLDMLYDIFKVCIIPLLGVLTAFAVKFLNAKSGEIIENTNNTLVKKYTEMINTTITNCVIATNQTYVEALKSQNNFGVDAQKLAFEKTFEAVLNILTADVKEYLQETTGDINVYLTQLIEAEVNKNKK